MILPLDPRKESKLDNYFSDPLNKASGFITNLNTISTRILKPFNEVVLLQTTDTLKYEHCDQITRHYEAIAEQ
jgi:hypothetical protein